MKLCLFLCVAAALASDITRPDDEVAANAANVNSQRIATRKPDYSFSPHGHAGDLSAHFGDTPTGKGAAWVAQQSTPSTILSCDAGKYEAFTLSGLRACFACPLGKFQESADSTHCDNCPAGRMGSQYGQTSESAGCQDCPQGQTQTKSGKSYCNTDGVVNCGEGHILALDNECIACPEGKYSDGLLAHTDSTTAKCYDCPANHYAPRSGMGACLLCARGKFNDRSGATYCMWRGKTDILPPRAPDPPAHCPIGKYMHTQAQYNFQHNATAPELARCQGTSDDTKCITCVSCPAGQYSDNNACTDETCCTPCPSGTYNPWSGKGHADDCLACEGAPDNAPVGSKTCHRMAAKIAAVTVCPAGTFRTFENARNGSAVDLQGDSHKANHAHANIQATCALCPEGQMRAGSENDNHCYTCPVGQEAVRSDGKGVDSVFDHSRNAARLCDDTDYENGGGNATSNNAADKNLCNTDDRSTVHWREGADACQACPKGTAWHFGQCKKCPAGTFQHVLGAIECIPCRDGTWSKPGSEFCTVKEAAQHCTGGRQWVENGKPCTKSCDNKSPHCPAQTVARCECPAASPYWDDRVGLCRNETWCTAATADSTCPEPTDAGALATYCATELTDYTTTYNLRHGTSKTFQWITSPYNKIHKRNGCKAMPCGKARPVSGCYVEKWGQEYDDGWTGNGQNEDWCKQYQCSGTSFTEVVPANGTPAAECGMAPQCSHLRCKFVAGAVKVKYDKLESVGIKHRCGHLDDNDPHNCLCTCFS